MVQSLGVQSPGYRVSGSGGKQPHPHPPAGTAVIILCLIPHGGAAWVKGWKAKRDPKAKMLFLQCFLRKGVSLGYVGRNYNLKDLKDETRAEDAQRTPTQSLISSRILVYEDTAFGCRGPGFGFRVSGRISWSGNFLHRHGTGFRVSDTGFRVSGTGWKASGTGLKVSGT